MQESHRITNLNIPKRSCPELYQELAGLTNRVRTERLRTLAVIGLYALNMQASMDRDDASGSLAPLENTSVAAPTKTTALAQNKQLLKSKLLDSM